MHPEFQYLQTKIENLEENPSDFEELALEIFRLQASSNKVYQQFLKYIKKNPKDVSHLTEIPFLPISFFKNKEIKTLDWVPESIFQSSGTTGQIRSRHFIWKLGFYHSTALRIFEKQFGPISKYQIIGLLPTYLENPNSSLISMLLAFGKSSGMGTKFCGLDFAAFEAILESARKGKRKILIFSVTYALLQLSNQNGFNLSDCLVIETGGMKGMGEEKTKSELAEIIRNRLKIKQLYSEYGMTELISQSYSNSIEYQNSAFLKVLVRDLNDPFYVSEAGRGAANIISLSNFPTCSFIATDDLCQVSESGYFQISGRLEGADLRGCNLLFA
jgi:acyl-CoA synthetase (AMP-forming)/AMP-acid ligase II